MTEDVNRISLRCLNTRYLASYNCINTHTHTHTHTHKLKHLRENRPSAYCGSGKVGQIPKVNDFVNDDEVGGKATLATCLYVFKEDLSY